jgi:large subunit ribosomal protein L15
VPIFRRLPKRGFNNARFAPHYIVINVSDLEHSKTERLWMPPRSKASRVITLPKNNDGIKVLAMANSRKSLQSRRCLHDPAKEKIEKAGGTAEEV